MQKAPGSVELKPPDKGEQPMDLAPRTAHPHAAAKPAPLQVTTIGPALRPHLDTAKSAFTVRRRRGLRVELACTPSPLPFLGSLTSVTSSQLSLRGLKSVAPAGRELVRHS